MNNTRKAPQSSSRSSALARLSLALTLMVVLLSVNGAPAQAGRSLDENSPDLATTFPRSPFGVDMVHATQDKGLNLMTAAQAPWVRLNGLVWSDVEPAEGARNWGALSELEAELQNANTAGMQVILVVRGTPDWAQKISGKACGPVKREKLAAFAAFMKDLVNRYKGQVRYWELWNEPDILPAIADPNNPYIACWGDPADAFNGGGYYAEMLQAVYPQIKAADPEAQVLVGGLMLECDPVNAAATCQNPKGPKFLEGILKNMGARYFDGISFHAFDYYGSALGVYGNPSWNSTWNTTRPSQAAKVQYIRTTLGAYGVSGKYLVNTEAGLINDGPVTDIFESTKAYYQAELAASALRLRLRAALYYSSLNGWRNTDLLYDPQNGRPAYYAFKFGRQEFGEAVYSRQLALVPGVAAFEFDRTDKLIWLVWSANGKTNVINFVTTPLAAYHVNGDPITISNNTLWIEREPVYIEMPAARHILLPVVQQNITLIANGGFENGVTPQGVPVGWAFSTTGLPGSLVTANPTKPAVDTDIPFGTTTALLGSPFFQCKPSGVPVGSAALRQTLYVPYVPWNSKLRLSFKYIVYTQDAMINAEHDAFEVYIGDSAGNNKTLVFTGGNQNNDLGCKWYRIPQTGWGEKEISLLSPVDYRGQVISIWFENWNRVDGWFNTLTYLDDVQILR